jgi:hypothetical protein
VSDPEERFTAAIPDFCAGRPFAGRMRVIAGVLDAFGKLEAAGDNPRAARVLFAASVALEKLGLGLE